MVFFGHTTKYQLADVLVYNRKEFQPNLFIGTVNETKITVLHETFFLFCSKQTMYKNIFLVKKFMPSQEIFTKKLLNKSKPSMFSVIKLQFCGNQTIRKGLKLGMKSKDASNCFMGSKKIKTVCSSQQSRSSFLWNSRRFLRTCAFLLWDPFSNSLMRRRD